VDLRLFGEFTLCGIFGDNDGLNVIGNTIKSMIYIDRQAIVTINLMVAFCRALGEELAGQIPQNVAVVAMEYNVEFSDSGIISKPKKQLLCSVLKEYFTATANTLKSVSLLGIKRSLSSHSYHPHRALL